MSIVAGCELEYMNQRFYHVFAVPASGKMVY